MATETLERAFAMTRGLLANVTPDDYDSPTPCPSWSVRDLVNHIAEGANWFALCVNAGEAPDPDPTHGVDYAAGDLLASYDQGVAASLAAFGAPGTLERIVKLPFGELPGAAFMGIATNDVFVHGWDLAKATGQPSDLDSDMATQLLAIVQGSSGTRCADPRDPACRSVQRDKRQLSRLPPSCSLRSSAARCNTRMAPSPHSPRCELSPPSTLGRMTLTFLRRRTSERESPAQRSTRSGYMATTGRNVNDLSAFTELVPLDHGLCVFNTLRSDGSVHATVVNAGTLAHPLSGTQVVALVAAGGSRKLQNLRADPRCTIVARAGWQWAAVEGTAEIIGPDDPRAGMDIESLRLVLRDVFRAAGGTHDDWDAYDRTMAEERRAAVLIAPSRTYTNPTG